LSRSPFSTAIIQVTVWMYAHFTFSLREVEELLTERGLDVSYKTVRRRFLKFGQVYARSAGKIGNPSDLPT
jgi:putative transposase